KDNLIRGREIFQERCIGCHGEGGAAVSEAARFMSPTPINFTDHGDAADGNDTSPGDYYYRILRGIPGSAMENFGTRLRVDDIWKVVLFVKTIPNGGLSPDEVPTPDKYIQWKPPAGLMSYVSKHPIDANADFKGENDTKDPFMLEAMRVLRGLNKGDQFDAPGFGMVSLQSARDQIKSIYEGYLDEGWADLKKRPGEKPPKNQRDGDPELVDELR
ncbi:MAG: c-type cytochrome, partial [Candidatus Aquicultor sp.]